MLHPPAAAVMRGPAPMLLVAAAALAWLALTGDAYAVRLATLAGAQALLVLGYQLVFGHAGALSLAQGALFGLGAYVAAMMSLHAPWSLSLTLPAASLAAMLVAALVGAVVLRLQTHYFALATLAVAQLIHLAAVNLEGLTGGANGLPGVPTVSLAGVAIGRGWPMLLLAWGLFAVAGWAVARGLAGLRGLALDLAREHPLAAQSIGIDVSALRFTAFVAGAGLAGLAGGLHAHVVGVVSPDVTDMPVMVGCLIATVIGGHRAVVGAALGAILLTHAPEWFRFLENRHLIAFGLLALAMVVVAPDGLAALLAAMRNRLWPSPDPTPPAAVPAPPVATTRPPLLLRVAHVAKAFGGVRALDDVSLTLAPGEAVGVIGPNGSGKTTLINVITGVVPADEGVVHLGSEPLRHRPAFAIARLGLARTFQHAELSATTVALDAVATSAFARTPRPQRQAARTEAMGWLTRLGAGAEAGMRCGALPAGRRRLIEVARALMVRPRVLILDEPGAGLSRPERIELARRLRDAQDGGVALLVVDHDIDFLAACADRLICLERGRVVADGPIDAVRRDPGVRRAYFGRDDDVVIQA
ncbi:ABC transporter permease subunit [Vineibacter terrae]|uniref:branched-chain amino acid ABC transporter ATP-binding protein/permease n=1 Tax=Vineibacter terrae TaxID=2586908 RepID=UPI002E322FFD|nr:ATP-binding cassette domain-containing protein [Vineibacter terrae]HEX2889531.1 ATP-binding cassette domain-containing protein [Vineibacter terrae]